MKPFLTPLSEQEEQKYLKELAHGNREARDILITRNMRLVAHIARKYQGSTEDMEELISIGSIGLIKGVDTYRMDKACRLGTYAARCIENELLMYFRSKKKRFLEVSLYEPVGTDREGNQIRLLDVVESANPGLFEQLEAKEQVDRLYSLLPKVLDPRELYIITRRYGLCHRKPMTQQQLSDALFISRSYVSRIEKKALGKLRENF